MLDVVELACELIAKPSVTPHDAGCQAHIAEVLSEVGFHCEPLPFADVSNLWATFGQGAPLILFAGHTDVVPAGADAWLTPPFTPTLQDGYLHGRGAADMKGNLAAMIVAGVRWAASKPNSGTLGFLITSDEEGVAEFGTRQVMATLQGRPGFKPDYCIVGEPSSSTQLGDTIRCGRRGSMTGYFTLEGTQGHVAYPHLADNPNHRILALLQRLVTHQWDNGMADFPPTSCQITHLQAGVEQTTNVIPSQAFAQANWRFSPASTASGIQTTVATWIAELQLKLKPRWHVSGDPFFTPPGTLREVAARAVHDICDITPSFCTGGGTSDGRFIAPSGCEVIELGCCNQTIHAVDERVKVTDLYRLVDCYLAILAELST